MQIIFDPQSGPAYYEFVDGTRIDTRLLAHWAGHFEWVMQESYDSITTDTYARLIEGRFLGHLQGQSLDLTRETYTLD